MTSPPKECRKRLAVLSRVEQRLEFRRDPPGRAREWSTLAPTEASSIVGTCTGELGNGRLDVRPTDRRTSKRGVEHDGRPPITCALEIEAEPTYIDERHVKRLRQTTGQVNPALPPETRC
jgi:hypothetical protein